jgi:hypothetical protein
VAQRTPSGSRPDRDIKPSTTTNLNYSYRHLPSAGGGSFGSGRRTQGLCYCSRRGRAREISPCAERPLLLPLANTIDACHYSGCCAF